MEVSWNRLFSVTSDRVVSAEERLTVSENNERKDVETKVQDLEETEVLAVADDEVAAEEQKAPEGKKAEAVPASTAASSGEKQPYSRKMVLSAFILGIVGTSLAVLALLVAIVGFSGGRGDHGHCRCGTVVEETEMRTDRSGRGGMRERDEVVIERFEERDGSRGDGTRGERFREREILEEEVTQSS